VASLLLLLQAYSKSEPIMISNHVVPLLGSPLSKKEISGNCMAQTGTTLKIKIHLSKG
jgi:hypothetical protein